MIHWKDFILDDVCGPVLKEDLLEDVCVTVYRRKQCERLEKTSKSEEQATQKQALLDEECFSFLNGEESLENFCSDSLKFK